MFTKLYRKLKNLDQIDSLNKQIKHLEYLNDIKSDKISNILESIKTAASATKKWEHLHRSCTSDQFPNTIKMVMHQIELGILDSNFCSINRSVVRDPNSPRGFSYR